MPLTKNASRKLVTSMYYLSVDGNSSLENKAHERHDTAEKLFELYLQEVF